MKVVFNVIHENSGTGNNIDYSKVVFKIMLHEKVTIDNSYDLSLILNILINGGAKKIVVNMKKLEYIDSSGIGILINTAKELNKNSGRLVITNVSSEIQDLFKIINLDNFINIYDEEQVAIGDLENIKL